MIGALIEQLFTLSGPPWAAAWTAAFVSMTFESTRPKPAEGEAKVESGWASGLIAIASLITPFLLFLHAFYAMRGQPGGWLAAVAALLLLIVLTGLIGWFVGAVAPNVGRIARRIAAPLSLAVLAFTAYVTWRNVYAVLQLYVLQGQG